MTWAQIAILAAGSYILKASGILVFAGRRMPAPLAELAEVLPAALLAALVAVQTFDAGRALAVDARLAGLGAAVFAIWRRAPFLVVVLVAGATTALVRLLA